jgi:hypothetical protein
MAQIGEVFGRGDLRQAENILQMTNAERRSVEEMDDTQSSPVTKAVVNLNQLRTLHIALQHIPIPEYTTA